MKILTLFRKLKDKFDDKVMYLYVLWIIKQDEINNEMEKMVNFIKSKRDELSK